MRQIFTKNKNSPDGRISASRRTVRRVLAFVLLFAVCGVSCSNIISERDEIAENTENTDGTENRDEGKAYYSLSGSVGQDGAVPRSVAAPYTNARSAVPNTDGIAKTYIVTAENKADGTTKTVTVNAPETHFEILLLEGTYVLFVTGYDASDKEILYGKYKNDIVLSKDHAAEQGISVYVHPISNDGGTGTVNLVMNLTGCGIKSYKAEWKEGGGILTTRYPAPDSDAELTAVHFTLSEDGTPVSRDIPVGFYTVTFSFYNDATQDEAHKLFSCSQTVNIYKNLETNWWKNSTAGATYISNQSGTFTLSPDVIRRYARHNFYVDPQRGSAANAGSWYDPFDSVKTAVKKICNTNDGEPYTVSLLSDDTDASGDSYTSEDNAAYINIAPAAALTLTILGRDDNDGNVLRTINAARTADKTGRVMFIGSKATVTLSNIGITGGYASDNGGGIFVGGAGTLTITDGTIDGNKAKSGGGVYVDGGMFTMTGGTISGNTATTSGGGGIYNAGTLKLSNVKITGSGNIDTPEALNGGGIAHADGSLTITGGTISECTAVYRGGGIRIAHGNVKITGLTISSCKTSVEKISNSDTITGGGGIYNISGTASAPVVLENCTITGCTVNGKDNYRYGGGGIYNDAGVLAITGGEITGGGNIENKDAYYGGGIYNNKGTLVIENGAKISDCTSSIGGGIYNKDGSTLTLSSTTITGCKAISHGGGIDNDGSSSAVAVATVTDCTIESCTAGNWEGGGIFTNGYSTLTVTGGSIVNSSATKGGGISASGTFTVSGVTIKNCTANSWGGGIYTSDYDESSKIENCTITGCSVTGMNSDGSSIYSNGGGGIANNSGGKTLTVTGGQITGCRAPKYGGGIYIVTGNLTVSGLTITGGGTVDEPDALYGGGICVDGGSGGRVLTMTDSEIKNCTASYGAAVWNGGTCNLTGCKITNCTAKTSGGGVIGASNSIATITNCTITGCTANGNGSGGGGIYINTSTVTVIGGTVSGCTGRMGGGIMCINSGSCTLDGCVVQDNTSIAGYGAVYISGSSTADAVLNVSGAAKITGTGTAQTVYLATLTSAVVITGELTEPVVAKIHSAEYTSAPTVLKDNTDDGSLVKAHCARFQSDHAGYSIYDDGVLRLPPTEGGVVIEEHTCTFSLDKTEITASGDQTLTVTAAVTTTGQNGTTQKTFSGEDLDWAAIKVFCGLHEVTQADFSGLSVNGGSVTIPFDMSDEAYYVQAAGTYTCENGCKKAFSGQIPFSVRRNAVPAGFAKINGGTVSGRGHPDIPDSAGSEHKGVFIAGRTVTLSPFMMCDHEVTQGEWEEVMAGNADGVTTDPSSCKAGSTNYAVNFGTEQKNRPVESMTWYDAVYYCNERSKKEGLTPVYDISGITVSSYGKITAATVTLVPGGGIRPNGYRLPTEAEWEFAARGGNPNSSAWNCLFSGAATASGTGYSSGVNSGLDSVGWYKYNNKTGTTTADSQTATSDGKGTHEVKQKAANSLGLYDMSGNVWEWCWDCTGTVSTGSEIDPTGASSESTNRINRGGGYDNDALYQNVCRRIALPPGGGYTNIGFRVVRSVSQ